MRRLFLIALVLVGGAFAADSMAQGTLLVSNFGVNSAGQSWSAPIYNLDGVTPLDSSFQVEMLIAGDPYSLENPIENRGDEAPGSTTQIAGSGLFSGPTLTFNGSPGETVYAVVVAWQIAAGSTWPQVYYQFGLTGYSSPFTVTLGSATSPGSLSAMPSFTVGYPPAIPEPRSLLLFGFGAMALVWRVQRMRGSGSGVTAKKGKEMNRSMIGCVTGKF